MTGTRWRAIHAMRVDDCVDSAACAEAAVNIGREQLRARRRAVEQLGAADHQRRDRGAMCAWHRLVGAAVLVNHGVVENGMGGVDAAID